MDNKEIEVTIRVEKETFSTEYRTTSAPRVGEFIDITVEELTGTFLVKKVVHRIFDLKSGGRSSYIIVEVEKIES